MENSDNSCNYKVFRIQALFYDKYDSSKPS